MSDHEIVRYLRFSAPCPTVNHEVWMTRAADLLELCLNQLQAHSLKMDGTRSYMFVNGWPMTEAKGRSPEDALMNAIKAVEREKAKP